MFNTSTRPFCRSGYGSAVRFTALACLFSGAGLCLLNSQLVRSSQVTFAVAFRKSQVIVQLKPGSLVEDVNARNETTTIKPLPGTNFYLLQIAAGVEESDSVTQLELDASVLDASLNRVIESPFTLLSRSIMSFPDGYTVPNQPATEYQLQKQVLEGQLNLTAAHVRSRGAGTTVAVIDTGIDRAHPVLAGRLWSDDRDGGEIPGNGIDEDLDGLVDDFCGWDMVNGDGEPTEFPDNPDTTVAGHGTFIAGLISILAPDCRIMPIRAFSPKGESDEFAVAETLKWATDHGADVINMSFGTPEDSPVLSAAIEYAYQQDAVLVGALGNEATDTPPLFPAHYCAQVMGVTAVDSSDQLAFFSNYGAGASMSALGKSIISTYPGSNYALWSGTSFSTPLVGAEAALLISADRNSRVTRQVIEQTALSIDHLNGGFAGLIGKGRIRPLNALRALNTNVGVNPIMDLHSRIELTGGDALPNAKGSVEISVTGTVQEVRIHAYRLTPGNAYRLFINGQAHAGALTAGAFGNVKVMMSTGSGAQTIQLPAALYPVTRVDRVELRTAGGGVVLAGDFDPVIGVASPEQTLLKEARISTVPQPAHKMALSTQVTPVGLSGVVRVEVDSEQQVVSIDLETPTSNGTYIVLIDGVSIGTFTSQSGAISARFFANPPVYGSLPSSILPLSNIRQITIVDVLGHVVAQGTFRIPGAPLGTG